MQTRGVKKLCIIDTGVGMSGPEMVKYVNSALHIVREVENELKKGSSRTVLAG